MEFDYSQILSLITADVVETVKKGTPIDPATIKDVGTVVLVATHCCINGPVGVRKLTSFPGVEGEIRIIDLFSKRVTNSAWAKFCDVVAEHLTRSLSPEQLLATQCYKLKGELWPRYDE